MVARLLDQAKHNQGTLNDIEPEKENQVPFFFHSKKSLKSEEVKGKRKRKFSHKQRGSTKRTADSVG